MAVSLPQSVIWGQKILTKNYILEMAGENFNDPVYQLPGFSLAAPEADTQDAVMIRTFTLEGGYIAEREHYARKSFHRTFSYELTLPPGVYWSIINGVANSKGICRRDFYVTLLCPEDTTYAHFWRFPDAILDQTLATSAFVATTEDEEAFQIGTTLRSNKQLLYYALGVTETNRVSTTQPLYSVAYITSNCDNCSLDSHMNAVVGGGDNGTLDPLFLVSANRFASNSVITNALATGTIVTDIYANGNLIVATYADEIDTSAGSATGGGIIFSTDRGVTSTVVSSPTTVPFYGITVGRGYYWAVGAASKIYRSTDLTNWTEFTNSQANASIHYTDIAYDPESTYLYISGYNGSNSVAHRIVGEIVADITSDVNAGAKQLYRVAVLETNHVVFGGEDGVLRENATTTDGGSFTSTTVAGSTADIRAIVGDRARLIIGAGTNVYERSRLTEGLFSRVTVNAGTTISGDITNGAAGETYEGFNYALLVTDEAEILALNGFYPGA